MSDSPWAPPSDDEPWDEASWGLDTPDAEADGEGAVADTLVLTDEELLALEAGAPHVPLPFVLGQPAEHREAMVGTALRGLTARGLIRRHRAGVQVVGLVRAVLTIRAGTPVLAVLRREVGPPVDPSGGPGRDEESLVGLRHLHVTDPIVLVEDVTQAGMHVFAMHPLTDLEALVAAFVDLDGAPPGAGGLIDLGSTTVAAGGAAGGSGAVDVIGTVDARLRGLGGPTTLVDAVVRDATGPAGEAESVTIALGPRGTFLAEATLRADPEETPAAVFRPVAVAEAATLVAGLIRDAVRRVEESDTARASGQVGSASATMGG